MAEHLGEAIAAFAKSHGGAVQREEHENEGHGPWPRSEIADLWVEDWCMGLKSAVEVQRDAAAVWQGGKVERFDITSPFVSKRVQTCTFWESGIFV